MTRTKSTFIVCDQPGLLRLTASRRLSCQRRPRTAQGQARVACRQRESSQTIVLLMRNPVVSGTSGRTHSRTTCRAAYLSGGNKQRKDIDNQIAWLAIPTIATLAADPVASLVDTAFIGHLGAVQLAGVGIALSVYSTVTKLFNVPLLSVATSSVATAYGEHEGSHKEVSEAASAVLLLAITVGVCEVRFHGRQVCIRWSLPTTATLYSLRVSQSQRAIRSDDKAMIQYRGCLSC